MLTREENERLTRVGPGTPGGELFRRYWQPVAMFPELTEATPTKHVRILGEDLVLFRDKGGRVGLLADHCPHRGASLLYGRVEERGIACAYHGWLYDVEGNCLETPAEPADSLLHLTVKHEAYPVQERYGLYWTYMGPPPAPVLPRYDVAERGHVKVVSETPMRDCNWLQIVENHLDQSHVFVLHQSTGRRAVDTGGRGLEPSSTTRGLIDELEAFGYCEAPFGIKRRQVHQTGYDEADLFIFPSTLRIYNLFSAKVPIDDTHTKHYTVFADLMLDGPSARDSQDRLNGLISAAGSRQVIGKESTPGGSNGEVHYLVEPRGEGKSPPDAIHPVAKYRMDKLRFQDMTVIETQGPLSARENEHLGTADPGVVLLRSMLRREIDKVQRGLDPIGVIRDPAQDYIDTYIDSYIEMAQRFPTDDSRRGVN